MLPDIEQSNMVAVCGGIGSGKSVVCRMLRILGWPVYDTDSRAKAIMDSDDGIKKFIHDNISREAICADGRIDRRELSRVVFSDSVALDMLDRCVHGAVREDIVREARRRRMLFVETALLYQSGIDRMVRAVWQVDAPVSMRIERVMERSGLSRREVQARIEAQDAYVPVERHANVHTILNDGISPVLPRVLALIDDDSEFIGICPRAEL